MRKLAIIIAAIGVMGSVLTGCSGNGQDGSGSANGTSAAGGQAERYTQPYFPAVQGNSVFFGGGDGRVHALDKMTGQQQWASDVITEIGSSTNFSATPDTVVYRDSRNTDNLEDSLTAVDSRTGQEKWHTSENGVSFTTLADGLVYYMGIDSQWHGKLVIRQADSGDIEKEVALADDVVNGPVKQGNLLLFAGSKYNVYTYDTASNQGLSFTLDATGLSGIGMPDTEPRATDKAIFLGSEQTVFAIDRTTGQTIWKYRKTNTGDFAIELSDGRAYVNDGSDVVALDQTSGAVLWRYDAGAQATYPLVTGGTVYVNSGNSLVAIDAAEGKLKWKSDVQGKVISLPAIADGAIYFGDDADRFYAVDAASGKQLWQYTIER